MKAIQMTFNILHVLIGVCTFLPDTLFSTYYQTKYYFPIFIYFILFAVVVSLYQLACGDPGYIDFEDDQPLDCENLFFCNKCQHYVPLRASHCKQCNKCVLRKDHHCPFLGICVGMKNHFYFLIYLITETILCIFSMRIFIPGMKDNLPFVEWLYTSFLCTSMFCLSFVILFQPILLFPFHFYLAFSNRTTWETLKGRDVSYLQNWVKSISPFSRGPINNFNEFMTMRWTLPVYKVPSTDDEISDWKKANSCISNDKYECC